MRKGRILQLSPGFRPRHNQLTELDHLLECLEGFKVAIELRNRGWAAENQLPATRQFFSKRRITFVMVDAPADPHFTILPNIDLVTSHELAYLRAHGRNAEGYIRQRTVAGRFDYDYPGRELVEIGERADKAAKKAGEVHVIFNNNKADYAPRAALGLQQILLQRQPESSTRAEVNQPELAGTR